MGTSKFAVCRAEVLGLCVILLALACAGTTWAVCEPQWAQGLSSATQLSYANAFCVYDDGTGPALYAASGYGVAKYANGSWSYLGVASPGASALAVYDDGTGPALYAGGGFTTAGGVAANGIAKWKNGSWSAVGNGMNGGAVLALAVYDDGTGPALYAAGYFTTAGGISANRIAKWKNGSWSALGSGVNGWTYALTVYDDGTGPALYAGGNFSTAGGISAGGIARWKNGAWSAVGSGACNGQIYALVVYDDGDGSALYAGGSFSTAGGIAARSIARWRNGSWSALSSQLGASSSLVYSFAVCDDGDGRALYVGGTFAIAGSTAVNNVAKWRSGAWSALGSGVSGTVSSSGPSVKALAFHDDGTGPGLYVGGVFSSAGGASAAGAARWRSGCWSALGTVADGTIYCMTAYDDGSGPALYAGGSFATIGGVTASRIARWKNGSWSSVGTGLGGAVYSLAVYDDGTGPALYAGGSFAAVGGVTFNSIAKWKNGSWSVLGSGVGGSVNALAVYNDGTGPGLYAGGGLYSGGTYYTTVNRWRNGSWTSRGSGATGSIYALAVYNDGTGPALYAGGNTPSAGCDYCYSNYVARLKNGSWSANLWTLGSPDDGRVTCLAVHNDGTGPALYAGGFGVKRWKSGAWSDLGSGILGYINSLAVYDDGTGPALFAAGSSGFGDAAMNLPKWKNGSWSSSGSAVAGRALAVYDDGAGPALYVGDGVVAGIGFQAKYGGCESETSLGVAGAAKALHDYTLVNLTGAASTAVFGDSFYLESQNRSSGIRVDLPGHTIAQDRQVSVTGRMRTSMDGERYIYGISASGPDPMSVKPLWLNLKALGGASLYDSATGWGQQGVVGGIGPNNIGLLVRCSDMFSAGGTSWFYVGEGAATVLVTVPAGVVLNPTWQHVSVTGLSSCIRGASGLERLIRVREQDDILAY